MTDVSGHQSGPGLHTSRNQPQKPRPHITKEQRLQLNRSGSPKSSHVSTSLLYTVSLQVAHSHFAYLTSAPPEYKCSLTSSWHPCKDELCFASYRPSQIDVDREMVFGMRFATGWTVRVSNPDEGEIFRTRTDRT